MQLGMEKQRQNREFKLETEKLQLTKKRDEAKFAGELLDNQMKQMEIEDSQETHKGMAALKLGQDYEPTFHSSQYAVGWEKIKAGNELQRAKANVETGFAKKLAEISEIMPEAGANIASSSSDDKPGQAWWNPQRIEALKYYDNLAEEKVFERAQKKTEMLALPKYEQAMDSALVRAQASIDAAEARASMAGELGEMKGRRAAERDQERDKAKVAAAQTKANETIYRDELKRIAKMPESLADKAAALEAAKSKTTPPPTAKDKALKALNRDPRFRQFSGYQPLTREEAARRIQEIKDSNMSLKQKTDALQELSDEIEAQVRESKQSAPSATPDLGNNIPAPIGTIRVRRKSDGVMGVYSGTAKDLEGTDYEVVQ